MNLFGAEGSAKKMVTGVLEVDFGWTSTGRSFANRFSISLLSIFVDQTRGKSIVIKNDEFNMNNQIGRLIFLVWTDLKPWGVKKKLHLK